MEKDKKTKSGDNLLVVVRVRGLVNLRSSFKSTFQHLNLHNKNWAVLVNNTPAMKGMILKVKDYVTWGEISHDVFNELIKKRGEKYKGRDKDSKSKLDYKKFIVFDEKKYNKYFRLSPPKKGYGRKGVKMAFNKGGALGYRGEKINDLIKRMI